jgi:hypothetical protein
MLQYFLEELVQRIGPKNWSKELVQRIGPQNWSKELVQRIGPKNWSKELVQKIGHTIGIHTIGTKNNSDTKELISF